MNEVSNTQLKTPFGKALITCLEEQGVEYIFGIPGVHTVELYRYLGNSTIRHITPRHEQGAGFMADGYARVSGKPGVCFLITGPGLTNALTPMAQARADSIPMVVISTVNPKPQGRNDFGRLHELPDQTGLIRKLAVYHHRMDDPERLTEVMDEAFNWHRSNRPGPVHIEIPLDVISTHVRRGSPETETLIESPTRFEIDGIVEACQKANRVSILAGGGAIGSGGVIANLSERLDAPLITTINARGIGKGSELSVPVSPSLECTRNLLEESDLVIALGTEFGPTDFNIYKSLPEIRFKFLIRVDIDETQLTRGPKADIAVCSDVVGFLKPLLELLPTTTRNSRGRERAKQTIEEVKSILSPEEMNYINIIHAIQKELPDSILVGDSNQISYAGNLYCHIHKDTGWFNAATGYGALGYSVPAAIGASLADSSAPLVCLVGDGGFQFTLAEMGTAVDEQVPVNFVVFNNLGYGEIKNYMINQGIEPIGVDPLPPDFEHIARAYRIPFARVRKPQQLINILRQPIQDKLPRLIEYVEKA